MLSLALKKIHRRANIEMLRSLVDYRVYTRLVRNMPMLKARPPVLLFLSRSWIYMKNNILNRLITESIEIKVALSKIVGYTVMHNGRFLSIVVPWDVRYIAGATVCCIPLLYRGSASIPEIMDKGTIAEVAL
jgi:hypothetical protein